MTPRIPFWLLGALMLGASVLMAPFVPWVTLALWLGLYARRVYEPLTKRLRGRQGLSAALTVSLLLVIVLPIAAVVTSIVLDAITLVQQLTQSEQAKTILVRLVKGTGEGAESAAETFSLSGIVDLVRAQGDRALAIARQVAGAAAHFVIGLLIMVTGMYGVLVDGQRWYAWCERHLLIAPGHLRRFGNAFIETGRGLWFGIVGAGVLQAFVATIAYIAIGVPSALALGMLTLLLSVIPAIGTALVWAPIAAGLAIIGRTGAAFALVIVGVVVIGTVDNLARPVLARKGQLQLPTWVVLIAMFGGVEVMGGWGLLIAPLVVRLAKEAIVIAREDGIAPLAPGLPPSAPPPPPASAAPPEHVPASDGEPVATTDAS